MNLAIIVGVSNYENYDALKACDNDIEIMKTSLEKLNKYEDICYISNSPKAHEVKKKIAEFVTKYKTSSINELVFYFSGHGDRNKDDFFYVLSDFNEDKRETTGLRNTELDGLIKNLNPKLTIKIIDACFSGTNYIKSTNDNVEQILTKSAEKNEFQNLYFLYSSSSEEESLANEHISFFTQSFFNSLVQNLGDIRYRDIMAFVADDMSFNKYPEPTFIVQANNTEVFGDINLDLTEYINKQLKIQDNTLSKQNQDKESNTQKEKTLFELIQEKSDNEYCTQEEAFQNIELLKNKFLITEWTKEINDIFELSIFNLESNIPNSKSIGQWLLKNNDENYFVEPIYENETYSKEEYIEIPKKPTNGYGTTIMSLAAIGFYGKDDKDYKLEKVEKVRQILRDIQFTAETPFEAFQIYFKPKLNAIENYSLTIVPIFSRKTLIIFNAIENLKYNGWNSISYPKCQDWKISKLSLKNKNEIESFCKNKIKLISKYILEDIQTKLSS